MLKQDKIDIMFDSVLTLAKNLITIRSTHENAEELREVLQIARNALNGNTVEEFERNGIPSLLAYNTPGRPEQFKIILNAHLDVVPGHDYQYSPTVKDGRLYGRGCYDMKAAAAAQIIAFKELAGVVNYPLALQLVTDEEIGGHNGTLYQIEKGVRGDFVIAGEPTDFQIGNKAKGVLWVKIKTNGTAAHGAHLWNGNNAITQMQKIIQKIHKAFPVPSSAKWTSTVNIARIETSNNTINVVPEDCSLYLDIRFTHGKADGILEKIQSFLPSTAEFEVLTNDTSMHTHVKNGYVKYLKKATKNVAHKTPSIIERHGGSDLRHFAQVGCEGVEFGPKGAGLHSDEEWVDIKSLEQYYTILKEFLLSVK